MPLVSQSYIETVPRGLSHNFMTSYITVSFSNPFPNPCRLLKGFLRTRGQVYAST